MNSQELSHESFNPCAKESNSVQGLPLAVKNSSMDTQRIEKQNLENFEEKDKIDQNLVTPDVSPIKPTEIDFDGVDVAWLQVKNDVSEILAELMSEVDLELFEYKEVDKVDEPCI